MRGRASPTATTRSARQHSARPLLGDFAALERLTHPPPRTAQRWTGSPRWSPGTALDAAAVHALTGGNPFFATEVAKDPDLPLPATVRDAVLARTAGIAAEDFEVLQLAASAPDRLDDRVLPALGVDLPDAAAAARHRSAPARPAAAWSSATSWPASPSRARSRPGGRPGCTPGSSRPSRRIEPQDPAVLTHHAVAAADAAAGRPLRRRRPPRRPPGPASHTEAVAFLETALAHLTGADPRERAVLLTQLAYEQYMTSRLVPAIATVSATFPLWQEAGDDAGLSAAHDSCAVFEYYNARRASGRGARRAGGRPRQRPRRAASTARPGRPVPTWRSSAATSELTLAVRDRRRAGSPPSWATSALGAAQPAASAP